MADTLRYVSDAGSDATGDGLTPGTAWATVQHALTTVGNFGSGVLTIVIDGDHAVSALDAQHADTAAASLYLCGNGAANTELTVTGDLFAANVSNVWMSDMLVIPDGQSWSSKNYNNAQFARLKIDRTGTSNAQANYNLRAGVRFIECDFVGCHAYGYSTNEYIGCIFRGDTGGRGLECFAFNGTVRGCLFLDSYLDLHSGSIRNVSHNTFVIGSGRAGGYLIEQGNYHRQNQFCDNVIVNTTAIETDLISTSRGAD